MTGDFVYVEPSSTAGRGARLYNVGAGTNYIAAGGAVVTAVINPGEPVAVANGPALTVGPAANNAGQIGTDYMVGIAATGSTNANWSNGSYVLNGTGSSGVVYVNPIDPRITFLANPTTTVFFGSSQSVAAQQLVYNQFIGSRVTIALTNGAYTVNSTDGVNNAVTIMPLDITKYPGKVGVAFRGGISPL